MKRLFFMIIVFTLGLNACNPSSIDVTPTETVAAPETDGTSLPIEEPSQAVTTQELPTYTRLNQAGLGAYASNLEISMAGVYNWSYSLSTKYDGSQTEYVLHIEGVVASIDPGDVRLVTDGITSRMETLTEGGETCVQFPPDYVDAPAFLTPEHLLNPQIAASELRFVGNSNMLNREVVQFKTDNTTLGNWPNADLTVWLDQETGALMEFEISAERRDPLFSAGLGTMTAVYSVTEIGPQTIDPIVGCEMDFPVMTDATEYVFISNVVSYQTASSFEIVKEFYQTSMTGLGWELQSDQIITPVAGVEIIDFIRGDEAVTINLESISSGTKVTLYLP